MKSGADILAPGASSEASAPVQCRELPSFLSNDVEIVRRAFRGAPCIPLRQAWRQFEEFDFVPSEVRVGWRGSSLHVFAEMTDLDIFNHATNHNQQLWLLGDSFEMFFQVANQPAYVEFHVTPNNHRLQLRYEDAEAASTLRLKDGLAGALLPAGAFESRVWVQPEVEQWFVYAEIPGMSVSGEAGALNGAQWRFSFGRYDYERAGMRAVLSSSSPHAEADFHRLQDWGTMVFAPNREPAR